MKGDGCIFQRGKVYWMRYYRDGVAHSVSCRTESKTEAREKLREEVRNSRSDDWIAPEARRVPISTLVQDHIDDLKLRQRETLAAGSACRWRLHLEPVFGSMAARALTTDAIRQYRIDRGAQGAAPGTIDRELQVLAAAFKLAAECDPPKVGRVPKFIWGNVDNARRVFIDSETEHKLKTAAAQRGLWQRTALEMAFTYGWRKNEVLLLRARNVSLADGRIRLDRTKNKEGREVPIVPAIRVLLTALVAGKQGDEPLFPRMDGAYWENEWKAICALAGVAPGRKDGVTLHDTRRSSARNKRSAGVSTSVIMAMMGWKTEAMFRRYAIVDTADMRRALEQEAAAHGGVESDGSSRAGSQSGALSRFNSDAPPSTQNPPNEGVLMGGNA